MKNKILLLFSGLLTLGGLTLTVVSLFTAQTAMWWYDTTGTAPSFKKEAVLVFRDAAGIEKARFDTEIADTETSRTLGLMFRKSMEPAQAMIFLFDNEAPRAFWMKNTRIPLDMLFIGADSTVVSIKQAERIFSTRNIVSDAPAKFVVELNLGTAQGSGLRIGDRISLMK